MSKMTNELIEQLYNLGKQVYDGKTDLQSTVKTIMSQSGQNIAESSAEFYIGLVKELIQGKGSTWNQNTDLLVYYVDHISSDYGVDAGSKAYYGGMKFALAKSRTALIDALNQVKEKHHLSADLSNLMGMKDSFVNWMKSQKRANGSAYEDGTIKRYTKALESIVAQFSNLDIPSTNLFDYSTLQSYRDVDKTIRAHKDFKTINTLSKNGNGDLSAAMNQYMKFLSELENNGDGENMDDEKEDEPEMETLDSYKERLETIKNYILKKGFSYSDDLIENFYLCLKSKPFVLLAGTSGTGKTRLVRLFAEAIGAFEDGRYWQVAVKPDWSDSTDLFGHVNFKNEFVPGAIIEFIKKAADDQEKKPYILCLDEMNLARVEYYFSDFLSIIETRDWDKDRKAIITDALVPKGCYSGNKEAEILYKDLITLKPQILRR